jgi:hypothetical protein
LERHPNRKEVSDQYGWTAIDPWAAKPIENYKIGNGFSYLNCGSHYHLQSYNISRDAVADKQAEIEMENPVQQVKLAPSWRQNHHFDNHLIFQWLFTIRDLASGPEQLWLECRYRNGSIDSYKGQREPGFTFTLSAGSVDLDTNHSYCHEGWEVNSLQHLALLFPELWKWRCISVSSEHLNRQRFPQFGVHHGYFDFEFFVSAYGLLSKQWQSIVARPIQPYPGLLASFQTVDRWLLGCVRNHPRCLRTDATDLPRRLIDVGPPDGSQIPRLHVRRWWHKEKDTRYAILSHCWGQSVPKSSKLTLQNMRSSHRTIDMSTLARNFQDAILITRG